MHWYKCLDSGLATYSISPAYPKRKKAFYPYSYAATPWMEAMFANGVYYCLLGDLHLFTTHLCSDNTSLSSL